jgi:hypothetical protein
MDRFAAVAVFAEANCTARTDRDDERESFFLARVVVHPSFAQQD